MLELRALVKQNTLPTLVYVPSLGIKIPYSEYVALCTKQLENRTLDLLHAAVGVSGEAGELLDAVKKNWVYNKPLDQHNVMEELGDLLFYITAALLLIEVPLEAVLAANVQKLDKRYPQAHYSDAAAQARADKLIGPAEG